MIEKFNFEQAKLTLSNASFDQRKKDKTDVEVSGLKVAGELLYGIGPCIQLALLIYLLTLISHIKTIHSNDGIISTFPWLALFTSKLSRSITAFTLVAYPFISSTAVAVRSNLGGGKMTVLLILYLVGFGTISFYIMRATSDLQRLSNKLSDNNTEESSN